MDVTNGNINNSIFLQYDISKFQYYPYGSQLADCDADGLTDFPSCNRVNDMDNSGGICTTIELCKNQEKALKIQQIQNKHSGEDERYENVKQLYNLHFLNMINLGVGTLFGLAYVYANYNKY
jgi:hypothetical protein